MTKKGHQNFLDTNVKIFSYITKENFYLRGHPRTSLIPGIQDPLHATVSNFYINFNLSKSLQCNS